MLVWWCFCVGVVMFLWWCFRGGVLVVVFVWWCFCGGVFVVVFLWWCFCAGVFVVVFLWWCSCGGVQSTTPVLQSTTPYYKVLLQYYSVLLQYYSVLQSTTPVLLLLQSTTPYYKVLLRYYKVLLRTTKYYSSTTPVLLCTTKYYSSTTPYYSSTTPILLYTTKYYSSTTPYYRALLRPLKRRQNDVLPVRLRTTPVLQKLLTRAFRARLPQLFTEKASKMIVSCEASSKFHRTSFQNERFARCFRQFSQKKLPKGSFRARLPPNFTEQASKTSVSRDASDNFHRKSFQKDRFARGFLQISQNKLPKRAFCAMLPPNFTEQASKRIVSREASSKFHRTSFQNERFARCFHQISQNKLPKRAFRAMLPTIFTQNLRFATVSRDRHTDSCERVHPPKAKCASHYSAVHSQISKCTFRYSGVRKNV